MRPQSPPNRLPMRTVLFCVYSTSLNLSVKVLDFVKSGGPKWTVGRTIFEMWLGGL